MRPGLFLSHGIVAMIIIGVLFLLETKAEFDCSAPEVDDDGMTSLEEELSGQNSAARTPFCKYRTAGLVVAAITLLYGLSVFIIPKRK